MGGVTFRVQTSEYLRTFQSPLGVPLSEPHQASDHSYRLGAAALEMFAGVAFGALIGVICLRIAPSVFGGAIAGIVTGLAFPELAIRGAEATFHFFAGLLAGARGLALDDLDDIDRQDQTPKGSWLRAAFTFGVIFALAVAVLLRL